MPKAIIVCGPTASGKTGYAHKLALKLDAEIVNADAMQIYRQFPIITAAPSANLQAELPYHLYNFLDIDQDFSVIKYVKLASQKIKEITKRNKLPIIVGGSGMHINSLISGYHNIPDIPEKVRNEITELREEMGAEAFFTKLSQLDPIAGQKLNQNDTQRVIRAYNVVTQTDKSIYSWQQAEKINLLAEYEFENILLMPERSFLYQICESRLDDLFTNGIIEEVESAIKKYDQRITGSALKTVGVREIISYIQGIITKKEAKELIAQKTRNYAKRQITWFTHQLLKKKVVKFSNMQEYEVICSEI